MPERRMVDMLERGGSAERGKWGKRRRVGRVQKEDRGWWREQGGEGVEGGGRKEQKLQMDRAHYVSATSMPMGN